MRNSFVFTSESVSEGHPDKVADQISDTVVDFMLRRDHEARVACETLVTTQRIYLAGEIRCRDVFDAARFPETEGWAPGARDAIEQAVRQTIRDIGYEQAGFHWQTAHFENHLHGQSPNIAQGVDASGNKDEGAGDQGIMFGYATDETPVLMPAPLYYAHRILERLAHDRHENIVDFLEPDSKSQVSLVYENGVPCRASALVVSTQHKGSLSSEAGQKRLREYVLTVLRETLPDGWMPDGGAIYVNPTGLFETGGPDGDAGVTGRKIIVDTYGGSAPHGGGAFSGKDPTKVDRSAAYAARYLAKNIVGAGLARRVTLQLSYAIGISEPLSILVDTHGTGTVAEERIEAALPRVMTLTPRGIRTHLDLNRPIYRKSASYGHFGRDPEEDGAFSWEKLDLVEALKAAL